MKLLKLILFSYLTLSPILTLLPAQAAQYRHCYFVTRLRTVRDSANHPTAYLDGYREGLESARKGETYQPRSSGGEFARGFDDGYYGKPNTGQQYIAPDRQEPYQTKECKTYYYDEDDPIDKILKDVLEDFERDLRRPSQG